MRTTHLGRHRAHHLTRAGFVARVHRVECRDVVAPPTIVDVPQVDRIREHEILKGREQPVIQRVPET